MTYGNFFNQFDNFCVQRSLQFNPNEFLFIIYGTILQDPLPAYSKICLLHQANEFTSFR